MTITSTDLDLAGRFDRYPGLRVVEASTWLPSPAPPSATPRGLDVLQLLVVANLSRWAVKWSLPAVVAGDVANPGVLRGPGPRRQRRRGALRSRRSPAGVPRSSTMTPGARPSTAARARCLPSSSAHESSSRPPTEPPGPLPSGKSTAALRPVVVRHSGRPR